MKIAGIISEYNPFHKGHAYQIEQTKLNTASTHIISIMSGNFVQRGEPAIFDKWTRARLAMNNGVDLVVELPAVYSTASAEYFSKGAVGILNELNCINYLSFGSEVDNLPSMNALSKLLMDEHTSETDLKYRKAIKDYLNKGLSFSKARINAITESYPDVDTSPLKSSNSILGIEYLKALNKLDSSIEPFIVKRIGDFYNEEKILSNFPSATAIRKSISTYVHLDKVDKDIRPVYMENFSDIIIYKLRTTPLEELRSIPDVKEGLEFLLKKNSFKTNNLKEFCDLTASKRYAKTRIKRILINLLLNIDKDLVNLSLDSSNMYLRILAFNNKGREILREISKKSDISIINNINKIDDSLKQNPILLKDIEGTNVYMLSQKNKRSLGGQDFTNKIIIGK